ncbi:yapsin, putative [Talaromyces stipitatus ATCC 10500]|uniref:Yapsin, putative n=1 Tax=Talaromyces stipitatus (strain ATCC 10500 / CBS 375.48 / QM 6759 / NRRL 1006) TaxID=441959 RepID=B8M959_TALSN|nr:yapsin, putative [Talaromyces stipitatus ATCC 10500]EED17354.1 yapsin, putative [Talaromyces stipitatus ATCC 10500]
MRVTVSLPFIVLTTVSVGNALSLYRRDAPAVLEAPIIRRQSAGTLDKRSTSPLDVSIMNMQNSSYWFNLTLGTPPQNFTLSLDTGSSDLWVVAAPGSGKQGGVYDSSSSSSFKSLGLGYNATYAYGTTALGTYATDTLGLGDATVKDFQFVVVNETSSDVGIAGVGYNISTYAAGQNKTYNNLPYALTANGITKSTAYSLWMDGTDADTGILLFGGVNKAKYIGELQTLPVVPVYNNYYSLALALTEVIVQTGDKSTSSTTNLPLAVSLDTGSPFILLPDALVSEIYKSLNATFSDKDGVAYVNCDLMTTNYNVTFSLSGAKINVGLSQLVLYEAFSDWPKNSCLLGIAPGKAGVNLLGDTFLRSAYVVYDLENNEISLANTNFNPGKDDILEIGTGANAVPGATIVPSAVSTATGNGVETATTGVVSATGVTTTASASSGGSSKSTSTSSGIAALATGNAKHFLSGLAGAGLFLLF